MVLSSVVLALVTTALAMKTRVPWDVAERVLSEFDIPTGTGWPNTIDKIKENLDPGKASKTGLEEWYRNHLLYGEKSIRLYELSESQMSELRQHFHSASVKKTEFSDAYPVPIDEKRLESSLETGPVLVGLERLETGIAAVYASIREGEIRHALKNSFEKELREQLDKYNFSEIVGIKSLKMQAFDVVWVPDYGNRIDIRIDIPLSLTQESAILPHEVMEGLLFQLFDFHEFRKPINLYSLIGRIYRNSCDGIVRELQYATPTASIKYEKMRRKSFCLRKEPWHDAGVNKIQGAIQPFKIIVTWPDQDVRSEPSVGNGKPRSVPELSLKGSVRMLHTEDPRLEEAVVRNCSSVEQFNFVRGRIDQYLDG